MSGKIKDLTGLKFGSLTAIKFDSIKGRAAYWLFRCDCGREKIMGGGNVSSGRIETCGKCKKKRNDISGQRFGRLVAISSCGTSPNGQHSKWLFKCDCGKEVIIFKCSVVTGKTRSCGCFGDENRVRSGKLTGKINIKRANEACRYKDRQYALLMNLLGSYKKGASKRGYSFELDFDIFKTLVLSDCYYCGKPPLNVRRGKVNSETLLYNGIDRVDSSQGYTIENCVPCCWRCNSTKGAVTIGIARKMLEFTENKFKGDN